MDLTMEKTPLRFLRPIRLDVRTQEETAETLVPDGAPDIAAVADCTAEPLLRGKDLRDGSLTISGGIKGTVLYLPEDESYPRNLQCYLPFTVKLEDPGFSEQSRVLCQLAVKSVDARVINARKALLRVSLSCAVAAYEEAEEAACLLEQPWEALETREALTEVCLPLEAAERPFVVRESLEIPQDLPAAAEIYRCRCRLIPGEEKLLGRKAVFKGALQCAVLYRDGDGGLHRIQREIPYSQYLELAAEYDREDVAVTEVLTGFDLETDGQEDCRTLYLTAHLLGQGLVQGLRTVRSIGDIYATAGRLTERWREMHLTGLLDRHTGLEQARVSLSEPLTEVLDAGVYVDVPTQDRDGDAVTVAAPVECRVLGYDAQGRLRAATGRAEVRRAFALAPQAQCCPMAALTEEPEADSATALRCSILLSADFYAKQRLHCFDGGAWEPLDEEPERPAVVLRTAPAGTELWELAKASRTSAAAIRQANHLEGDVLQKDAMVLIPAAYL